MKESNTQEPVKIFIADFKSKLLREKATQSFGRADHWNTESEAEHNEAEEAHLAYQATLKQYPATWITIEMDGKEFIEGKDFFTNMDDNAILFPKRSTQEPVGGMKTPDEILVKYWNIFGDHKMKMFGSTIIQMMEEYHSQFQTEDKKEGWRWEQIRSIVDKNILIEKKTVEWCLSGISVLKTMLSKHNLTAGVESSESLITTLSLVLNNQPTPPGDEIDSFLVENGCNPKEIEENGNKIADKLLNRPNKDCDVCEGTGLIVQDEFQKNAQKCYRCFPELLESKSLKTPPSVPELPSDEEVSNWFPENIDTGCSASSAIYKFRLWLKDRMKASLPQSSTEEEKELWEEVANVLYGFEMGRRFDINELLSTYKITKR